MRYCFLVLCFALFAGCQTPEEVPPNIIVIMADDMGYSDIGSYGGEVQTPVLDRMAADGVRFTQFYNTARCCPTRASLMTGLYPHQAGVGHMMGDDGVPGYRGDLSFNAVTIAEALGEAGYKNYMSGKWHITRHVGHWSNDPTLTSQHNWPLQRGFDRFFGTIHGAGSFYDPISLARGNEPIEPYGEVFYYTDAINENAAAYIREHAEGEDNASPFFLYIAHTAPHWPTHALEDDIAKYEGRYNEGWDILRAERLERMKALNLVEADTRMTPRDPRVPEWGDLSDQERKWFSRSMEVYAAQIDRMDQGIGGVFEALEETGQLNNTLVMFLADNGGCAEVLTDQWTGLHIPKDARDGSPVKIGNDINVMPGDESSYQSYGPHWANASNTPFRLYKHWVHEGGISSPFIMYWPNKIKEGGGLIREPGHVIDIMSTALDAAGATYPASYAENVIQPQEGRSLLPAIWNEAIEREALFWEHEGNRAVRQGDWKAVSRFPGEWELYDLSRDREELDNLAESHPDTLDALVALYEAWADRAQVVDWGELQEMRRAARGG